MFCERIGLLVSLSLVQDSRRNQPQLGSPGTVSGGNRGSDEDFSGGGRCERMEGPISNHDGASRGLADALWTRGLISRIDIDAEDRSLKLGLLSQATCPDEAVDFVRN